MRTRTRTASGAKHQKVDWPASNVKLEIARILKEEGFINNYKLTGEGSRKTIRVYLRHGGKGEQILTKMERVSKPGCRVYTGSKSVPKVLGGRGSNIVSAWRGLGAYGEDRLEEADGDAELPDGTRSG